METRLDARSGVLKQAWTVGCACCAQWGALEDCLIRVVIKEIMIGELAKRANGG